MLISILLYVQVSGLGYDEIGKIYPKGILPVSNSITNTGRYSDYTFTFETTNEIPINGVLSITFPQQFESNLGIAGNPTCSVPLCTLSGYTVDLTFSQTVYANKQYSVTIYNLKNPSSAGGTGNFKLVSSYYEYIIDMNLVFGTVGISERPSVLTLVTVSILPGSSNIAGDITKYLFTFQSNQLIPAYSWIMFTFPSGMYIPNNPSCSSYATTGGNIEGDLQCVTKDLSVVLTGISKDLKVGVQYNIRMTGTNPNWSGSLGFFGIYVFREDTNTLYLYKDNISGFYIEPSDFLEVSLSSVDENMEMSRNCIMMYELMFRTKNPIEALGYIILEFPASFSMDGNYLVWVDSGLEDYAYNNTVIVDYSIPLLTLTISNFKPVPAETYIKIVIQLKNPSTSGVSENLKISTLRPDAITVIDTNSELANVTISTKTSPIIDMSYPTTPSAGGSTITIDFDITPNIFVPANGYVAISLPSEFSTTGLICSITPYGSGTDTAQSCVVTSGVIWVQLFVSTLNTPTGPGDFQASQLSTVSLTVLSPTNAGYYYVPLSTYDTSKILLETGGVMVQITASAFSGASVYPMNTGTDSPTVLVFSLTASHIIPSAEENDDLLAQRGYIEIQLPTQENGLSMFDLDLGIGITKGSLVSCRGILVISGSNDAGLTCTVTTRPVVASIGTPVIVTVTGFYEIPSNAQFIFHLAGIRYLLTANTVTITVSAYSITNRIRTDIHTGTFTLATAATAPASTSPGSTLGLSSQEVQDLTTLSFTFTISAAIGSTSSFLLLQFTPTHDEGYCRYLALTCSDGTNTYTCYCYPSADMVSIYLTSGLAIASYTFTVFGLTNPQSVSSIADGLDVYIINNMVIKNHFNLGTLPLLTSGLIRNTVMNIDQNCASCVNVGYEFYLRCKHSIPAKGSIVITLDPTKSYSLHYSTPKPYCYYFSANGAEILDYVCTPYKNLITLSGLPHIQLGVLLRVILSGVKNPSSLGSLGTVTFESKNEYGRVINSASMTAPSLVSYLVVEQVTDALVTNFPTNANALAEYSIFFTPIASTGPGAVIEIDFPTKNFDQFINPPDCRVSIGIQFVQDCIFDGKTFRSTVNSIYHNSQITVHILGIKNFPKGKSETFAIRIKYDGVVLQKSLDDITVTTSAQSESITTTFINFYPKNEGEISTYEFHITPSQSFSTSEYLTIIFPKSYDKRIGDFLDCWATGLSGYIKCEVVNSWTLRIIDHDAYIYCSSCNIVLFIYGVINPNHELSSNTGQFKIGVYSSSAFSMLNENSGELDMLTAAGFLNLFETVGDNEDVRTINVFTFNFTTSVSIPSIENQGAVWVQFSEDYILKGSVISCLSSNYWASGAPDCESAYDIVKIYPQSQEYAGNLKVVIQGLCNPLFEGYAGFINVKVFDGFNSKILVRSFPNLSKNRILYTYPGPRIHVNNDERFLAERGTVSQYIKITMDYPCALNLTLIPYTFGFVFIPTKIELGTGMLETSFRVSVPSIIDDTEYIITWEIIGEASPNYYTPITKSVFQVTKLKNQEILFNEIPSIPKGGQSIPIKVILNTSPYKDINLLFSLSTIYSGLSMLPKKMEFLPGTISGYFRIFIDNTTQAEESYISVSLQGSNSDVYFLTKTSLEFYIHEDDKVNPDVTSIAITQISRAKASAVISTNKVSTVYYACALYGTIAPSTTELKQGGPPSYNTSEIFYGTLYIDSSCVANITLKGLSAATSYTVWAIAEDQMGVLSLIIRTANFTTLPLYSPAIVNMWFSKTYLTTVEKEIIRNVIALVLGLGPWQVIESAQTSSRRLDSASDQVISLYQVYLIDNPKSDDYLKPKDMISMLQSQIAYLNSSLNNFNASAGITGQEVVLSSCSWFVKPHLLGTTDYKSITFAAALVEAGILYGVAVSSGNDTGIPINYQIARGFDAANRYTNAAQTIMSLKTEANLTFSNLTPNSNYNLYITCGNLVPVFPQLGDSVVVISWKTDKEPAPELLSVSFGVCLEAIGVLMLLAV